MLPPRPIGEGAEVDDVTLPAFAVAANGTGANAAGPAVTEVEAEVVGVADAVEAGDAVAGGLRLRVRRRRHDGAAEAHRGGAATHDGLEGIEGELLN